MQTVPTAKATFNAPQAMFTAPQPADWVRPSRLTLCCEKFDLTGLARQTMCEYAQEKSEYSFDFQGNLSCCIWGDPLQLRRVIRSLLDNATKHSAVEREICVSVWRRGSEVRLSVEDQGSGPLTNTNERLFGPLVRLNEAQNLGRCGGIGLLRAQRIVQAHGGEMCLQGTPARGMTVELCFEAKLSPEQDISR